MFRFAVAGLATAEAATLAITWSDCGAKHATVTDLQPTAVHTGATETVTGTGTVDEDVTSANFKATVSALGAELTSCSGDGTKDIVCTLPMGVGKITVKALSFPLKAGTVSIPVEVQTSSMIPPSLANVDIHIAATEQAGEDVICLDVHTSQQNLGLGDGVIAGDHNKLPQPGWSRINAGGAIGGSAWSPDGSRVISGSSDKLVRSWDITTGNNSWNGFGHTDAVNSVAYSPDGKRVVSGSNGQTNNIRIWDALTGEALRNFTTPVTYHEGRIVHSVAYSPDGEHIVSGNAHVGGSIFAGHGDLTIWNVNTGDSVIFYPHMNTVLSVAYSPDGTRIVSGSADKTVRITDALTGACLFTLKGHLNTVTAVAYSLDGKHVVSGGYDGALHLWDALTGLQVLEIKPPGWHPAWGVWVWSVAYSPDGKHVVSGSDDGAIRIFDATTGEKLHELTGHSRLVSTVAYRSDGAFLLSASHDGTLRIWNATGFDALPAPPISI